MQILTNVPRTTADVVLTPTVSIPTEALAAAAETVTMEMDTSAAVILYYYSYILSAVMQFVKSGSVIENDKQYINLFLGDI